MKPSNSLPDPDFVRRTLAAYGQQFAGLATLFTRPGPPGGPPFGAWQGPMLGAYQQLFAPASPGPFEAAAAGAAALARWQRAAERFGAIVGAVSNDACARLARALADDGPPITTIAALHALWIDCGEAAWAEAAHRDDFADAQAELLASLAGLKAGAKGA
jgi:hypothetical protein